MRTAQVATLLVGGFVLSALLFAAPAAAGCRGLVSTPSDCVVDMYESVRDTARGRALAFATWGGDSAGYAPLCADIGLAAPDPGDEARPFGDFAAGLQQDATQFQRDAGEGLFPALATFIGQAYFGAVDVGLHYNDRVDAILLPIAQDPANVPVPQVDPSGPLGTADTLVTLLGQRVQGAQACASGAPSPPV